MKDFDGRVAVVTGAASGIGRALAERCAREGMKVVLADVEPGPLAEVEASLLAGGGTALAVPTDVSRAAAVEALAGEIGPVDILFNCAGYVHHGSVLQCSDEDWDFSFDLNVKSMHRMIKTFLPGMLEKKRGAIINISSAVSSIRGVPNRYAYGTTKAAVIGLTKAVAADFIRAGIRCNAICPGTIESPSLDGRVATLAKDTGRSLDAVRGDFVARQPMGRLGTPNEVAALALFLASDEASYITGQAHLVDGGMAL